MTVTHGGKRLNLKQILAAAQITALPQSAIRLLELSRDPRSGPADYAAPIEADPGLAGQVLKFVNSSYFSFARQVSSVKMGISLVGVRTIKNFALWNAVFSLVPNPHCGPFDLKSVWQDSLRRGLFARAVAKACAPKATEEVFTAALLQDMTVPLLAKEAPQVYIKLLQAREHGQHRLSALEHESFGWTHGDAAAQLARNWNLPEEFAVLIERHVGGIKTCPPQATLACRIVALSALLPAMADPLWIECAAWEKQCGEICPEISDPCDLLGQVDHEFKEFAPVLKVAAPRKSLLESYREALVAT